MQEVFRQLSKAKGADGEPLMTKDCMKRAFEKLQVTAVTEEQAQAIFDSLDKDGNGTICYSEFQQALTMEVDKIRDDPKKNPLLSTVKP